jgi:hypothetical protein
MDVGLSIKNSAFRRSTKRQSLSNDVGKRSPFLARRSRELSEQRRNGKNIGLVYSPNPKSSGSFALGEASRRMLPS